MSLITEQDVVLSTTKKTNSIEKLRELTEQILLKQVVPAGALVSSHGDILYLHGRTGKYLEPAPGESGINNILKMAREGLRQYLTIALLKASSDNEIVHYPFLQVKTNNGFATVDLTIYPVNADFGTPVGNGLYMVVLEETQQFYSQETMQKYITQSTFGIDNLDTMVDVRIAALKKELQDKEEYLQTSNEELETTNEEMLSFNEELQSTNEELVTSKEELQTVNEELATVNAELQNKVADLSRANNDMNNLIAGTGTATIFIDRQLCILRFTPQATDVINLIKSDVGRPIGHLVSNLVGYDNLVADVQTVLDTLIPIKVEVQTSEGKVYSMRILPYRTIDNVIEGVVISFFDITAMKALEQRITQLRREQESFMRHEINNLFTPIIIHAENLKISRENLTDRQARIINNINENVKRITSFIEKMKYISSFEMGNHELQMSSESLNKIIEQAITDITPVADKSGVEIQYRQPDEQVVMLLDINFLPGVFSNLVLNAIEHVAPLTNQAEKTVSIDLYIDQGKYIIRITNRGEPIPPAKMDTFFEKFNTGRKKRGGTGLGTTYAYYVTKAHGGNIEVTSNESAGTTVTVSFPGQLPD